jgi:hypothetical protein
MTHENTEIVLAALMFVGICVAFCFACGTLPKIGEYFDRKKYGSPEGILRSENQHLRNVVVAKTKRIEELEKELEVKIEAIKSVVVTLPPPDGKSYIIKNNSDATVTINLCGGENVGGI